MTHRICILGAVREEIAGVKGRMKIDKRRQFGKTDAWSGTFEGNPIVLVRTGVGKKRAGEALTRVLDNFPVSTVVSIGYAGGTHPDLAAGDLLIADRALTAPKDGGPPEEVRVTSALAAKAANFQPDGRGFSIFKGSLLTVDAVVRRPEDKKMLGETCGAMALDMETFELAGIAADRNLPFLSVRAISDAMEQELVDVSSFVEKGGEISRLKAGWYVLTHPGLLKDFKSLKEITQLAANNLTEFLTAFLRAK